MNEVIKNIMSRRSIRAFEEKQISREDLEQIVDCGRNAPSGMNKQAWKFTVVQNKDMLNMLAKAVREELGRDESYDFYAPDVLILVSNERDNHLGEADCACALENMFLCANSLGLGSVWINQFKGICDKPNIRAVLQKIKMPEAHIVWGCAALGYQAAAPRPKEIKDNTVEWLL